MFLLQVTTNLFLFFLSVLGIMFNKKSILTTLICIKLMLLSTNLNFILFSVYIDDMRGQILAMFVLSVAAAESSIGLAIIILYFRVRESICLLENPVLRG
jgi:NADH-quinone oxidoreductase subunit K